MLLHELRGPAFLRVEDLSLPPETVPFRPRRPGQTIHAHRLRTPPLTSTTSCRKSELTSDSISRSRVAMRFISRPNAKNANRKTPAKTPFETNNIQVGCLEKIQAT